MTSIFSRSLLATLALSASMPVMASSFEGQGAPASTFTQDKLKKIAETLPVQDREDFELIQRGFIATAADGKLRDSKGEVVGELTGDEFFARNAPESVNPSLWRNSALLHKHGLFKVKDRIYQLRGFSISNITIIEGDTGYIVVDPGAEAAAVTGMKLVREHLGDKPVVGVIYTHSHSDHYAGVRGVLSDDEAQARKVPIIAPKDFMHEILGETIIAGPAMVRRAGYQFGRDLDVSDTGAVTLGIGPVTTPIANPNTNIPQRGRLPIAPSHEITHTGETLVIDGVKIEFQLTPHTEAPSEMHFYLPELKALCLAENANGTLHNALPARGALVRDVKGWADQLTQALTLYGDKSDVLFTSHFWPRWGQESIQDYLGTHRDAYKYLHDQSVRLMNDGLTGPEIADALRYPDALSSKWYNREYYGTLSHNSRAVCQRYMGFYDGNPINLNPLTPEDAAKRYVSALGGDRQVLKTAKAAIAKGDYRWAADLLNRLIFADGKNQQARETLAQTYEQLAYQAESSTWRNGYLVAAKELRQADAAKTRAPAFAGLLDLPLSMFLDGAAVRLNPERAVGQNLKFVITDAQSGEHQLVELRNSVLIHQPVSSPPTGVPIFRLTSRQLFATLSNGAASGLGAEQDAYLAKFASLFDGPIANFNIVTP